MKMMPYDDAADVSRSRTLSQRMKMRRTVGHESRCVCDKVMGTLHIPQSPKLHK